MGYAAAVAGVADGNTSSCATQALATSNGDVIAVGAMCMEIFGGQTITAVTDTAGNSYSRQTLAAVSENGAQAEWWVCNNATGHAANVATITWSGNARYKSAVQVRLTGADNVSPVADADKASVSGSATVTTPTMTSAGPCTVLAIATSTNDRSWTPDASPAFTELLDLMVQFGSLSGHLQYYESASAWNDTVTAVASSGSNCVISAVIINANSGAAASDVPRRRQRQLSALLAM